MAFTYVTLQVSGGYRNVTGADARARIQVTPLAEMVNGTHTVDTPVWIPLTSAGVATKPVAATTDPATVPVGNAYRIDIEAGGRVVYSLVAAIPHDQGSTLDISSLVELDTVPTLGPPRAFHLYDAVDFSNTAASLAQVPRWDGTQWLPVTLTAGLVGAQPASDALARLAAAPVTLTATAGVITPDAGVGSTFLHVATADVTLATPTGTPVGVALEVLVKASGANRVLSFASGAPAVTVTSGTWQWCRFTFVNAEWALSTGGVAGAAIGWLNVRDFGALGNASADDTAAVQSAIDAATALTVNGQQYGGVVYFPPGVYRLGVIQLKPRVRLIGSGAAPGQGYRESPVRFLPHSSIPDNGFMITHPAGELRNAAVVGIASYGSGATSLTGFMNLPEATACTFHDLHIDNYGIEAAIIGGSNNRISYSVFEGLWNRAAITSQRGAFTLSGADHQTSHCEFTGPGRDTVSSSSLFCAAAKFSANDSVFDTCVFQIGDVGLAGGGARTRFVGCRFDSNAAHGVLLDAGVHGVFSGCTWSRNSYSGNGQYDHINVPSSGGSIFTFTSPLFSNNGRNVRYCINDAKNSDTFNNTYMSPYGETGNAGFWSVVSGTVVPTRGRVVSKSANYTAVPIDATVLGTSGASGITITLPSALLSTGLTIKKVDAGVGALTVTPASGTIDGSANATISTQNGVLRLVSNGTNWFIT